jgi:hypothetical protein
MEALRFLEDLPTLLGTETAFLIATVSEAGLSTLVRLI